jgi:hypothetical protein
MKVKCINKRDWLYITIGKTHEVIYENIIRDTFKIIDDDGDVGCVDGLAFDGDSGGDAGEGYTRRPACLKKKSAKRPKKAPQAKKKRRRLKKSAKRQSRPPSYGVAVQRAKSAGRSGSTGAKLSEALPPMSVEPTPLCGSETSGTRATRIATRD